MGDVYSTFNLGSYLLTILHNYKFIWQGSPIVKVTKTTPNSGKSPIESQLLQFLQNGYAAHKHPPWPNFST